LYRRLIIRGGLKYSKKCKKKILFNLHFLQNNPLVQLITFANDSKRAGNIPGSQSMKALQVILAIPNYVSSTTNVLHAVPVYASCNKIREELGTLRNP
jgi:hypothetical protein